MARLRWPKSIHSQIESVFRHISAIGQSKKEAPEGFIRSVGTMTLYRTEAHSFVRYLKSQNITDLRQVDRIENVAKKYFEEKLSHAQRLSQSYQTQKTRASAIAALERGFNAFFKSRGIDTELNLEEARKEYLELSKATLRKKTEYPTSSRAYPRPEFLVYLIDNKAHALQATLQYQGGLRAEGVGAPSGKIKNPLTQKNLKGIVVDPVSKERVGAITVKEKGGKWTTHLIPKKTYERLSTFLAQHGKLESNYQEYRSSIIIAAKLTGQHAPGRGTHALKTSFAQFRYATCVKYGYSHEEALQATALELAHNRFDVTLAYLKG